IHIEQSERDLLRVNGLEIPLPNTITEKEWKRLDKAVPYDEKDNAVV
uniref:Uncharacterized protein n=1 Tax=Acrobeloides nanus TaxID=290746 RepID=A0A914D748_9BILA